MSGAYTWRRQLSGSEKGLSASIAIYRLDAQVLEKTDLLLRHIFGLLPPSKIFGSSPNSGEGRPDLEEEVGIVAEAVSHSLDDLDLVVDALDEVGAEGVSAVGEDAGQV